MGTRCRRISEAALYSQSPQTRAGIDQISSCSSVVMSPHTPLAAIRAQDTRFQAWTAVIDCKHADNIYGNRSSETMQCCITNVIKQLQKHQDCLA